MSTKTLRKRIALGAVVALVSGLVSVAPANAAVTLPVWIDKSTTVGGTALSADTLPAGVSKTSGFLTDSIASITAPAGTAVVFKVKTGGTFVTTNILDLLINGTAVASTTTVGTGAVATMTSYTLPSTAGTYNAVVKFYATAGTDRAASTLTVEMPVVLTVTDLSAFSAGVSTQYLTNDVTAGTGTSTTDAAFPSVAKSTGQKATLTVDLKRADNSAYAAGTYYVSIDGPGYLDIGAAQTADSTDIDGAATAWTPVRSESIASDAAFNVLIGGDGTSGVGTLKSYVILADGVTKVSLPDKKIHFYGTVAKLVATVLQPVATVGTENGNDDANAATQATQALTPAIVIKATDSAGELVPGLTITATPADTTVIASATAVAVTGTTDLNGPGYYNSAVTGGALAFAGKSTTVVFKTIVDAYTTITSAPVTLSLGGTPASVTLTTDKSSYAPGEKVVVTVSAKDAAGNAAGDGTYANLLGGASSASGSISGSLPAASVELTSGKATYTAYAPATPGSFLISNTVGTSGGAASGTAISATIKVVSPSDAQIASLIAKINALSKLIAKIQKKLGIK